MSPSSPPSTFPPVDDQLALLRRGAVDLVEEAQLREKLERSSRTGKPLVVKTGFDPTSPHLHLGHTVLLRKMRHFQDLGHRVIFLIGDFTGMIGDPSGKKATRPQLSRREVEENARTYQRQVYTVLDQERTVIEYNSRWLGALGAEGMIRLAGSYTLARMMERVDFRTRFEQHQPISLHELLYPLVQGYDSIALEADVELGGHDQIFNLLVGRDLMRERGMDPQVVLTVPLLLGTDGADKMSKSLGNAIGLEEPPREVYGKTMSIPDALMWDWLLLLTDTSESDIAQKRESVARGNLHPKGIKQELARRLVAMVHGDAAAEKADAEFERVFSRRGRPENVELREAESERPLQNLLVDFQLSSSRSDSRRLIQQGAVTVDGERVDDPFFRLPPRAQPYELRVGKLRFLDVKST
jgi:tyrosyl-tRNA synthetase